MKNPVIETIWSRRARRAFSDEPIDKETLDTVVEAARWAPSAGNRRLQKFVVVQDGQRIRQVRTLSPGMWGYPAAFVVICTDWQKAEAQGHRRGECGIYIDVGTAMENVLLAAHALGLGAGPVTSFSKAGVQVLLNLPRWLSPEVIVCLGHPLPKSEEPHVKPPRVIHWKELTYWEQYDGQAGT